MSRGQVPGLDEVVQRAFALHSAGNLAEAEPAWRAVLARAPKNFDALHMLGALLHQRRSYAEAILLLDRAVAINPAFSTAWTNRGLTLAALGRLEEAQQSFQSALKCDPRNVQAWAERARILRRLQRWDEARVSAERAIAMSGGTVSADARIARACAFVELSRFAEALDEYNAAFAARPPDAEMYVSRAAALQGLGRYQEAADDLTAALERDPDHPDSHRNLAMALFLAGRSEEALAAIERAIALIAAHAPEHGIQGMILNDLGRVDEALACFERALALAPDDADNLWNASLVYLSLGDFARGWAGYEERFRKAEFSTAPSGSAAPRWDYTAPKGRRILLHAEQGLGDTIQFVRYAPLLAARGARVFLEAQAPLRELLKTLTGVEGVYVRGESLPEHDVQASILSMPRAFGTTLETIPAQVPYLTAPHGRIAYWRSRLEGVATRKVGIVWSGNPDHKRDNRRSIAVDELSPLFNCGVTLINLQPSVRPSERSAVDASPLLDYGAELSDFADTAGLVANLDLVISVDTSVAHLAGALGKPVWILLSVAPDWRWLRARSDSPWYPSARLFQQMVVGDWVPILSKVAQELRAL